MKKYIVNVLFLILPFLVFGQTVQERFSGFGNISSVTSLGSSNYTVALTGFTGSPRFEVNGTWAGSDVGVGDVIFRDGARYVITLVNSSSAGGFNVRVNSPDEGLGVSPLNNGNIVAVGREYMGLFPLPRQGDNAGTGVPPSLASSIQIHNMKMTGTLGGDYITTDSFSTFVGGITFTDIPINKTVWSTTRGAKFQKTSSTAMTRRSYENGQLASTIFSQTSNTLLFNANLNNRAQLITLSSGTAITVSAPTNIATQAVGEVFQIGIQNTNDSSVVVTWNSIFGAWGVPGTIVTTTITAGSTVNFLWQTITDGTEGVVLTSLNDLGNGVGVTDSLSAHRTDITNLQTLSGRPDGSTNLGTMAQGTEIPNNLTVKVFADSTDAKLTRLAAASLTIPKADTLLVTQTAHQFLKGQLLSVVDGIGQKADADSTASNAIVISRVSANSYIVQFSGITDSLPNVEAGKHYYTSGIKGEATQVPPTRNQLAYRGLEDGRTELVFSNFQSFEQNSDYAYVNRVFTTKPNNIVAYYPMNEPSGTTMTDRKNGYNGTYSNVTLSADGVGDRQTSANFAATNSYANANVAGVVAGFNTNEGAMAFWIYVDSVWLNDSTEHFLLLAIAGASQINFKKTVVDSVVLLSWAGNQQFHKLQSGWNHIAASWSRENNRFNSYVNGRHFYAGGGFPVPLPAWTGGALTGFIIGNSTAGALNGLKGRMAHFAIWNTYLADGEINRLSALHGVDFTTNPDFKTVSQKSLFTKVPSEANDWLGRPNLIDAGANWIMLYRAALDHNDGGGDKHHIRFSSDEGVTWSKRDTLLDGTTPVSGAPFNMHATTTNAPGGDIILALNGNLLVHIAEQQPGGHKTYQWRSTDSGATWTDEGGALFPNNIICEEDYALIPTGGNAGIYVIARDVSAVAEDCRIYRSTNNGISWALRGSVETLIDANESGLERIGGDTLICVLKTSDASATYQYYSYDAGATWTSRIDITDAVGEMNKPRLEMIGDTLYLFGRQQIRKPDILSWSTMFKSSDDGAHWSQAFHPDSLQQFNDGGYGDILPRTNGDIYAVFYSGSTSTADIVDYVVRDTSFNLAASPVLNAYSESTGIVSSPYPGAPFSVGSGNVISGLTDNYIPRALGTDNLENSSIYDTGSGVIGINTTTPGSPLHLLVSDVPTITPNGIDQLALEDNQADVGFGLLYNRVRRAGLYWSNELDNSQGAITLNGTTYPSFPKRMEFFVDGITTPKMTLDSLGKLGLGIRIPEAPFHIFISDVALAPSGNAQLYIEKGSDDVVFQMSSGTTRTESIFFGDPTSVQNGFIQYQNSSYTTPNRMIFATSQTSRWIIGATGHLIGATDNTYDIGAPGATRPRTGYFGTSVIVPALAYDATTWNGNLTVPTRDDVRDKIESLAAGGVTSFETRTGAVVSANGDYTATEITNTPAGNIAAITVQAALNELDTEKLSAEVDGSVTNEGALSVGAAGANTSQIATNTSGDGGVILKGGTNITLSESADTITITATTGADNLGNHTATQALNMNGFNINAADTTKTKIVKATNTTLQFLASDNTITGSYTNSAWDFNGKELTDLSLIQYTTTGIRDLSGSVAPEASVVGSPGDIYRQTDGTAWIKRTGTSTNTGWSIFAGGEYKASLSPTTSASGEFTATHNLGTTQVVTRADAICDACNYIIHRKSTSGITTTTAVFVVRDAATGLTVNSTSMSVDVTVARTQ